MGATRLASGTVQLLFSRACILFFHYPDARRVAPISACVSSSTKRYNQALPSNANSNGGRRVSRREQCSCYLVEFVFFSFIIPTRDASPPLVLASLQALSATTKRYN